MTRSDPTVSVLMNCYNGEKYIRESIESVLAQTYKDFELVIWDNVSIDRSWQIIAEYKDVRIIPIRATKHTTLAEARKLAFPYLRGKWVAIVDVDDLWMEDKLEKQLNAASKYTQPGFVYCSTNVLSDCERLRAEHIFSRMAGELPEGNIYRRLLRGNYIAIASLLINRECLESIGGFSGKFPIMEDYYITLNLARKYPVVAIQDSLCDYRLHGDNASLHTPLDTFEDLQIVRGLFPDPPAIGAAIRIILRHFKKCLVQRKMPRVKQMTEALV